MAMKPRSMKETNGNEARRCDEKTCNDETWRWHDDEEACRYEARRCSEEKVMALKKPQKSLKSWTKQKWRTKSGKPSTQGSKATGERYLPEKAIKALTAKEYAATTKKKREATKKGKQVAKQPKKIAKKTAKYRKT